jgi:hypothetical protein
MMKFWSKSTSPSISEPIDDDESIPPPPPPPPLAPSDGEWDDNNNPYGRTLHHHDDEFAEEASIEYPIGSGPRRDKRCSRKRLFLLTVLLLLAAAVCLAVLTVQSMAQEPGSVANGGVDGLASSIDNNESNVTSSVNQSNVTSSDNQSNATSSVNNTNLTSTAPPCVDKVSVNKLCYEYGEDIIVSFKVCDPTSYDWVGLYRLPDDTEDDDSTTDDENIFSDRLRYSVWTCGLSEDEPGCDEATNPPPTKGTLDVSAYVRPGSFKIYLARGEDPSLPSLAESKVFSSSEVCSE